MRAIAARNPFAKLTGFSRAERERQPRDSRRLLACCDTCHVREVTLNNPHIIKWHLDPALIRLGMFVCSRYHTRFLFTHSADECSCDAQM